MKISKREKILSIAFVVTAILVWMTGGEGNGALPGEIETPLISSGRIFDQYRRIRPLPELKSPKKSPPLESNRNIFQFGSRTVPDSAVNSGLSSVSGKDVSGSLLAGQGAAGKKLSSEPAKPRPPEVDFKLAGIILAGPVRAAVITRSPELFVVRESRKFLNHFILKSVKRKGIVIGYTDFKDELFIPLKKDGGLQ
ncbi:MAG: hypothetical protein GXO69_07000 [Acidobacteria bacterium]|nr:hypothetical protein [Acidobacteriota bacterium]